MKTEEAKAKRLQKRTQRVAELLGTFDVKKEVDGYLDGKSKGEWGKRIATTLGVPPLVAYAARYGIRHKEKCDDEVLEPGSDLDTVSGESEETSESEDEFASVQDVEGSDDDRAR